MPTRPDPWHHAREQAPPGRTARILFGVARIQGRVSHVRHKQEAVTTEVLIEALRVSRSTFYRYVERGIITPPEGYDVVAKVGRRSRWTPAALACAKKVRALLDEGYTLAAIEARLTKK